MQHLAFFYALCINIPNHFCLTLINYNDIIFATNWKSNNDRTFYWYIDWEEFFSLTLHIELQNFCTPSYTVSMHDVGKHKHRYECCEEYGKCQEISVAWRVVTLPHCWTQFLSDIWKLFSNTILALSVVVLFILVFCYFLLYVYQSSSIAGPGRPRR